MYRFYKKKPFTLTLILVLNCSRNVRCDPGTYTKKKKKIKNITNVSQVLGNRNLYFFFFRYYFPSRYHYRDVSAYTVFYFSLRVLSQYETLGQFLRRNMCTFHVYNLLLFFFFFLCNIPNILADKRARQ